MKLKVGVYMELEEFEVKEGKVSSANSEKREKTFLTK